MFKKILPYLDDVLVIAGCASIVVGVSLIYTPAAWIVAGVEAIAWGWLFGKYNA